MLPENALAEFQARLKKKNAQKEAQAAAAEEAAASAAGGAMASTGDLLAAGERDPAIENLLSTVRAEAAGAPRPSPTHPFPLQCTARAVWSIVMYS